MLISHSRPAIAWTLIGTGAAWLTDADALTNGRPASASRVQWSSGVLTLRGTWGSAIVPRVVGLVGLTLDVGTVISLAFRRPADAGYTYLDDTYQQAVTQLADGSRCAWFVLPDGLDPVIGVEYRVTTGSGIFDIGEAWIGAADDFQVTSMSEAIVDPTIARRSYGSQPFYAPRRAYRTAEIDILPLYDAKAVAYRDLRQTFTMDATVVIVPSMNQIQQRTMFGNIESATMSGTSAMNAWDSSISFQESPASAV